LVFAFALICLVAGQNATNATELSADEVLGALEALNTSDINDLLIASNLSEVNGSSFNSSTLTANYVPLEQPPANFTTIWGEELANILCGLINLANCTRLQASYNEVGVSSVDYVIAEAEPVDIPTPTPEETPTPGETPTPEETPTPGETPTPTPEETPTPTPLVTPTPATPTPVPINCAQCDSDYEAVKTYPTNTGYTRRCADYNTFRQCLVTCNDDTTLNLAEQDCAATTFQQDLCTCDPANPPAFDGATLVDILRQNKDTVIFYFNGINGVVAGSATFPDTVDNNGFTLPFQWNDDTQHDPADGNTVTLEEILTQFQAQLADFLNIAPEDIQINQGSKRATQDASFQVAFVQSTPSGASALTMSFAFVLVGFLLQVIF